MVPRPMRTSRRKNLLDQFNFMVAGASNLGKSAFLRTFLRTLNVSAISPEDIVPTPQVFGQGPTTRVNQVSMIVEEPNDRFGLTMVDTPGFIDDGSVEEQCRLLTTFLENQFDARLIEVSRILKLAC
jgi:cell division control protein 11